jgi:hypothetical protein
MSGVVSSLMNMPDPKKKLGFPPTIETESDRKREQVRISLILASNGVSAANFTTDKETISVAEDLISNYREKVRLLSGTLCPPVQRVLNFVDSHFAEFPELVKEIKFPTNALVLPTHGLARTLSFPIGSNKFEAEHVTSYKLHDQGVLHNPKSDKRTTQGSFHDYQLQQINTKFQRLFMQECLL